MPTLAKWVASKVEVAHNNSTLDEIPKVVKDQAARIRTLEDDIEKRQVADEKRCKKRTLIGRLEVNTVKGAEAKAHVGGPLNTTSTKSVPTNTSPTKIGRRSPEVKMVITSNDKVKGKLLLLPGSRRRTDCLVLMEASKLLIPRRLGRYLRPCWGTRTLSMKKVTRDCQSLRKSWQHHYHLVLKSQPIWMGMTEPWILKIIWMHFDCACTY